MILWLLLPPYACDCRTLALVSENSAGSKPSHRGPDASEQLTTSEPESVPGCAKTVSNFLLRTEGHLAGSVHGVLKFFWKSRVCTDEYAPPCPSNFQICRTS
jgi:hypothetical protein